MIREVAMLLPGSASELQGCCPEIAALFHSIQPSAYGHFPVYSSLSHLVSQAAFVSQFIGPLSLHGNPHVQI